MGYWLKDFGAELHELEVPYNDSVDPADVERYLDEHPEIELLTVVHSETPSGTLHDLSAIGPIAHAHGATDVRRLCLLDRRHRVSNRRVADRHRGRRRPEVPRRAAGISLMAVSDAAWQRDPGEPRRAARPRSCRCSTGRSSGSTARSSRSRRRSSTCTASRPAATILLEEGLEASIARHELAARACRAGVRGDGARARGRGARRSRRLRDGDHRARGADRRTGARPLPRALRRDDLGRPGRREPRPHRPHGPDGELDVPRRRLGGARAHVRRPRRLGEGRRRRRCGARGARPRRRRPLA